jgi:hypothetical protein
MAANVDEKIMALKKPLIVPKTQVKSVAERPRAPPGRVG